MEAAIRKVVCAACYCRTHTVIVVGPRHWDSTMHAQLANFPEKFKHLPPKLWEQGFIDQFGKFMDRKKALKVVIASGQAFDLKRNGTSVELFSEGLY